MRRPRWRRVVSAVVGVLGLGLASLGALMSWLSRSMVTSMAEHRPRPLTEDSYVGALGAEGMTASAFQTSLWIMALGVLLLMVALAVAVLGRRRP